MSNPPDDFDDTKFGDLEADLEASYDDPLPEDFDVDAQVDLPADETFSSDEEFSSDDNWDDQAMDVESEELDQPPPRKKSSLLTYAIIGVVVLGGGAFALTQMGGAPAPEAVAVVDPEAVPGTSLAGLRDEAPLPSDPVEIPPEAPPQGFMNETAPPSLPPAPALTAVDADLTTPPVDSLPPVIVQPDPVAPPADPAVIGGLKPVSDFPSVDLIKKSDLTAAPAPAVPVPDATAGIPVPAGAVNSAEVTVLQGRLEAAQTKIDSLEKALESAKAAAVAAPSPAPETAVVNELEEKIAALEEKLQSRERDLKAAKAVATKPVDVAPMPKDEESVPDEVEAVVQPVRTVPAMPSAKATAWELRGAQPGKAMLGKVGGGGDIRTVSAGDTVPGLGRITLIEQTASGWVVQGTQGRVVQ